MVGLMFHPCKKCIVRACCSNECNKFNNWRNTIADLTTTMSLLFAGISVSGGLFYLGTKDSEGLNLSFLILWIVCFIINNILFAFRKDGGVSILANALFAPIITVSLGCIYGVSKYVNSR